MTSTSSPGGGGYSWGRLAPSLEAGEPRTEAGRSRRLEVTVTEVVREVEGREDKDTGRL